MNDTRAYHELDWERIAHLFKLGMSAIFLLFFIIMNAPIYERAMQMDKKIYSN